MKVGDYIYTSWGYDQTNIDFAVITEISKTGKTIKARRTKAKVVDDAKYSDGLAPTEPVGDWFRLYVRYHDDNRVYFVGQYPYCLGFSDRRMGYFWLWDGNPKYETKSQYGH